MTAVKRVPIVPVTTEAITPALGPVPPLYLSPPAGRSLSLWHVISQLVRPKAGA